MSSYHLEKVLWKERKWTAFLDLLEIGGLEKHHVPAKAAWVLDLLTPGSLLTSNTEDPALFPTSPPPYFKCLFKKKKKKKKTGRG